MASRTKFFGGNWKCNGSVKSVTDLVALLNVVHKSSAELVVAPSSLHVGLVKQTINPVFQVAAQNCSVTGNGAFTGEISADQIADFGLNWVILGHSERRQLYGESDSLVGSKVKYALSKGLKVIACIGETLEERKADKTMEVCIRQLSAIGSNVSDWSRVVIAYEPVWAIGTGVTATSAQAQEVHADLRKWIAATYSDDIASSTRIIYGGSVKGSNSRELMSQPDVDGGLVGGASLTEDFLKIIADYV